MRIAHIVGKMKNAGVESVVFSYTKSIDKAKYETAIIFDADSTAEAPMYLSDMGVDFIEVPPYQHLFCYMKSLVKIFREGKYDIVHSHINSLSVFPLLAAKIAGVKVRIAHSHTTTSPLERRRNFVKNTLRPLTRMFATDYVGCSEAAGRWLFGDKNYDRGKVTVIHNAVNVGRFMFDDNKRRELRRKYLIDENALVIGHIGRFVTTKNQRFIVDAFNQLHIVRPDTYLILMGDGELLDEVKAAASRIDARDYIIFLDNSTDVTDVYSAIDVFVLPSLYEGLPVVIVESLAAGLPCIVSDKVTREAAITDDVTFLPITDINIWAEALEKIDTDTLFRKDKNRAIRNGRFNIDVSVHELETLYEKLYGSLDKIN